MVIMVVVVVVVVVVVEIESSSWQMVLAVCRVPSAQSAAR